MTTINEICHEILPLSAKLVNRNNFEEESAAVGNDARGAEAVSDEVRAPEPMPDVGEDSGAVSDDARGPEAVLDGAGEPEAVSDEARGPEVVLDGAGRCEGVALAVGQ